MLYIARNKWLKEDEDCNSKKYNEYDQKTSLSQVTDQLMHHEWELDHKDKNKNTIRQATSSLNLTEMVDK